MTSNDFPVQVKETFVPPLEELAEGMKQCTILEYNLCISICSCIVLVLNIMTPPLI